MSHSLCKTVIWKHNGLSPIESKWVENTVWVSRGPLLLSCDHLVGKEAVLTVVVNQTWYALYLIRPDKSVVEVIFPDDDTRTRCGYVDHCPNPDVVMEYAEAFDWHLDPCAYEMMLGRWVDEVRRESTAMTRSSAENLDA